MSWEKTRFHFILPAAAGKTLRGKLPGKEEKNMKRKLALALGALLLLTGCASTPASESPAAGQTGGTDGELRELNVVLDWYPNALHAFLYDAIEKGYYEEEGLKVNIQFPSNTNDAISLVAAGQAEIGLYYQQDVIIAWANQDVPVKSIGAVVQAPLNIVLSLAEKDIHSPEDLVGKTIGYAGTELSEALIRSIMAYVGADSSDVEMIDVGFDLMSSMTTGNVDATIGCLVNHEVPQMEVDWLLEQGLIDQAPALEELYVELLTE